MPGPRRDRRRAPRVPLHALDQQFNLHWRLHPGAEVARADGLVERRHPEISDVWLELVGLDAMGRPVSFGGAVHIHWASPWDTQTFATSLQPKGGEARFEVRVRSFAYQEGAPTKG
jgi:hypothetical protein